MQISAILSAPGWWSRGRSFVAGALAVLAFAPYGWWFLLPLVYGIWLRELFLGQDQEDRPGRNWFLTSWFFGFGQFVHGLLWMNEALLVDAAAHAWLIPFCVTLIPGFLALFPAVASWLAWRWLGWGLARRADRASWRLFSLLLVMAALMSGAEWLRGHVLTGFPWNLRATVWVELLPVAQLSAVIGPYGLSLLTLLWSLFGGWLLLVLLTGEKSQRHIAGLSFLCSSLLFVGIGVWGQQRMVALQDLPERDVAFRIVQPNILQAEKWQRDKRFDHIVKSAALSWPQPGEVSPDKEITIWPETAVPFLWEAGDRVDQYMGSIARPGQYLLSGIVRMDENDEGERQFFNALAQWKDGQSQILYDKKHLVPFGEYMPFGPVLKRLGLATITRGSYTEGNGPDIIPIGHGLTALPLICYEAIFPSSVARRAVGADVLLNITNDGWFGQSAGPWQHAAAVRFRAIETGKMVLRAANTGISMVVLPTGKLQSVVVLSVDGVLKGRFVTGVKSPTIYSLLGDKIFGGLVLFLLCVALVICRSGFKREH